MIKRSAHKEDLEMLDDDLIADFLHGCKLNLTAAYARARVLRTEGARGESGESLKKFAHRLAGSAGIYGYSSVGVVALRLENLMRVLVRRRHPVSAHSMTKILSLLDTISKTLGFAPGGPS